VMQTVPRSPERPRMRPQVILDHALNHPQVILTYS
jgi:hypothetical protein